MHLHVRSGPNYSMLACRAAQRAIVAAFASVRSAASDCLLKILRFMQQCCQVFISGHAVTCPSPSHDGCEANHLKTCAQVVRDARVAYQHFMR